MRRAPVSYNDSCGLFAAAADTAAARGTRRRSYAPVDMGGVDRALALLPGCHVSTAAYPLRELGLQKEPSPLVVRPYARYGRDASDAAPESTIF